MITFAVSLANKDLTLKRKKMNKISIDFNQEQLAAFYRSTSADGRKAIKESLGENFSESLPVTERVKTYEDAVNELGTDHPFVEAASSASYRYPEKENNDIIAYLKARVIVAALNEGWVPEYTEEEERWYPWYRLYTQEEVDDMSEEQKEEIGLLAWGGSAYDGSYCGLGYVSSNLAFAYSSSSFGGRLAFKSKELAVYAGRQFIEVFADFCFIPTDKKD